MAKNPLTDRDLKVSGLRASDTAAEAAASVVESEKKNGDGNANSGHESVGTSKQRAKRKSGKKTNATPKGKAKISTASEESESDSEKKRIQRPYPTKTLEEAMVLVQKIKEKNNGKPWRTADVADACGYTHVRSGGFFYLSSAARDYGITAGSYNTEKVEISDLGRRIVYAGDPASERQAKIEAFFKVDIFKKVFDHYGGSKLPEEQYLSNTLQNEFGLHVDLHAEFVKLYTANCKYLGIESGLGEGDRKFSRPESTEGADVRVVGEAKGKFDRTAFVIMPFNEKGLNPRAPKFFEEVLNSIITPAANEAGFAVETALRHGSEVIQSTIINQLLQVDLVICDLTDHNPNVLFELGIRIAKELPVALIRAEGTGPIFDVDHMLRVQPYSANLWPTTVARDMPKLAEHFKATWDNRSVNATYMSILTAKHAVVSK
jgi:hypothetical protein